MAAPSRPSIRELPGRSANMEAFVKHLWEKWADPKNAWTILDSMKNGALTLSAWRSNAKHLRFTGDLVSIFSDLSDGSDTVTKEEFMSLYLRPAVLEPEASAPLPGDLRRIPFPPAAASQNAVSAAQTRRHTGLLSRTVGGALSASAPSLLRTPPSGGGEGALQRWGSERAGVLAPSGGSLRLPALPGTWRSRGSPAAGETNQSATQRPSTTARRENRKWARYAERIENCQSKTATDGRAEEARGASEGQGAEALLELFREEVAAVNGKILECFSSIRLDNVHDIAYKENVAAAKRREEARRRKEAEAQKLRKMETEARLPKQKVKLKLETRRKFGVEEGVQEEPIPLRILDVLRSKGIEHVQIVDVHEVERRTALSNRLVQGATIEELLNLRLKHPPKHPPKQETKQETTQETKQATGDKSAASTSTGDRAAELDNLSRRSVRFDQQTPRVDVAIHRVMVKLQKDAVYATSVLNCLRTARGSHSVEPAMRPMVEELKQMVHAATSPKLHDEWDALAEQTIGRTKQKEQAALHLSSPPRRKSRVSNAALKRAALALTSRVAQLWAKARAAVRLCLLLFRVKRMNKAADIVKEFAYQMCESARLRKAIHRARTSIKSLQGAYRSHAALKLSRVEKNEEVFQQIEEKCLPKYVEALTEQAIAERLQQLNLTTAVGNLKEQRQAFYKQIGLENKLHWRSLCIPVPIRRALLNWLYTIQQRRKARQAVNFTKMVLQSYAASKEMIHFLKQFGVTDVGGGDEEAEEEAQAAAAPETVNDAAGTETPATTGARGHAGSQAGNGATAAARKVPPGGQAKSKRRCVTSKLQAGVVARDPREPEAPALVPKPPFVDAGLTGAWWAITDETAIAIMAFAGQSLAGAVGWGHTETSDFMGTAHWYYHPGCQESIGGRLYQRPSLAPAVDLQGATSAVDAASLRALVRRFDASRLEQGFARSQLLSDDARGQARKTAKVIVSAEIAQAPPGEPARGEDAEATGALPPSGGGAAAGQAAKAAERRVEIARASARAATMEEVLERLTPRLREIAVQQGVAGAGPTEASPPAAGPLARRASGAAVEVSAEHGDISSGTRRWLLSRDESRGNPSKGIRRSGLTASFS